MNDGEIHRRIARILVRGVAEQEAGGGDCQKLAINATKRKRVTRCLNSSPYGHSTATRYVGTHVRYQISDEATLERRLLNI